jgi:two-component system, NarL family, response regulator DevR
MTCVLLVGNHEILGAGLHAILSKTDDILVMGEPIPAEQLLRKPSRRRRPDVVLLMGQDAGHAETIRSVNARWPSTRVIVLASPADQHASFVALQAGAHGCLSQRSSAERLVSAVRAVASGALVIDAPAFPVLHPGKPPAGKSDGRLARLSPRELEVLELLGDEMTNREIARRLGLSAGRVKNHVSSILSKLEVRRRSEAAAYLASHGRWKPSTSNGPANGTRATA